MTNLRYLQRMWRFQVLMSTMRNQTAAHDTTRRFSSFKRLLQASISQEFNISQNDVRPSRKDKSPTSLKKINLSMAKELFIKDIGVSLMEEVNWEGTGGKDLAWLVLDLRQQIVSRKLQTLEDHHIISLFHELRTKHGEEHRTAFVIEDHMMSRLTSMDLKTSLLFSEVMVLSGFRGYKFLSALFQHLSFHIESLQLETEYIPRLMFLVFFHGSAPLLLLTKLEEVILENFDKFTLKEVSVICLGYFRGHSRIHSYQLLDKIANKTIEDIEKIDEKQLTNILKAFRHSGYIKDSFYSQLAERLCDETIPEKLSSLNAVMQLLMAFASLKFYHKPLIDHLTGKTVELLDESQRKRKFLRSKEIAKITWAVGSFCKEPEEWKWFSEKVLASFRRMNSPTGPVKFPESIADVVQGLIYMEVFPMDLIEQMLQPSVATQLRDHPTTEKIFHLLLANSTARIECPHYTGPFLTEEFEDSLRAKAGVFRELESELRLRRGLVCVLQSLEDIVGAEYVHCHFILPHMKTSDIEIRLDSRGVPLQFEPQDYKQVLDETSNTSQPLSGVRLSRSLVQRLYSTEDQEHVSPNKDEARVTRLVVEVVGRNQCAHESELLLGNFQTKLRQLRKLGYVHWVILPEESRKLEFMERDERRAYLRRILCDEFGLSSEVKSSSNSSSHPDSE